ncbi:MAG TPA: hypothetical protein VFL59_05210 [Candidatus Nanopelagicales bacterium]|nr:hypothetical protein [Candidatus Nanopelagicales bacterium]
MTDDRKARQSHEQPDPEASSDGDASWTDDPVSGVDPDEDRSVETVVERQTRRGRPSEQG